MTGPQFPLTTASAVVAWLRDRVAKTAALTNDSRSVNVGDVFLAWPGHAHDGRDFVADVLRTGAAAVLVEASGDKAAALHAQEVGKGASIAWVADLEHLAADIASQWWSHPSKALSVAAITGTNGKTTVAWWLAHLMQQAGQSWGYVGTLGAGLLPAITPTGLTSPEPLRLQAELAVMRDQHAVGCAIEASSIGLEQGRLAHTDIRLAVFTNLTQDHLDYHGTMQAYGLAKRALFEWPTLTTVVINGQDAFGRELLTAVNAQPNLDIWDYAVEEESLIAVDARLQARQVQFGGQGVSFSVVEFSGAAPDAHAQPIDVAVVKAPAAGLFNVQNLMAVLASMRALGVPLNVAAASCSHLPAVPGRMQLAGGQDAPLVVVDYAHTPDALRAVLNALRPVAQQRNGRLHVVFGCGGDRDSSKRPLMAMAAAQAADQLWITSDNPRSEEPLNILAQVMTGLTAVQQKQAQVQVDRRQAIAQAIHAAGATDVVLIAGKGHEDYQEVKGVKLPFSDAQEVQSALLAWQTTHHQGACA